ncbi:unnamed protein product [Adineta steineri]|uniref:Uncharacterized protein n=1 Tax=Adineta steineri TaxID=433720 RepID=A0A813N8Q9_9BILA|nr:unnamed protein product [Adineta steineri]CAF3585582.1 unnamed protein product [Adineta steineri]
MNISNINSSTLKRRRRRMSSNIQSKDINSMEIFIQLCFCSNEKFAYETMKILFSSRYKYSLNLCDEFGCNILMYTLRYQRYKLFDFLLNDISLDINLQSKDQQGNTILHYAIIYANHNIQIIENLIEKFNKFAIDTDERNIFGFTPLLLAAFCGRYNIVMTLLNKTDASPFVRDNIQLKNLFDYIEIDMKQRKDTRPLSHCSNSSRKSIRLRIQLYQTLPLRSETQNYSYKNFFENILPQAINDCSGSIRSSILTMFDLDNLSTDLKHLINYINQRYPQINTSRKQNHSQHTTKFVCQYEDSKTNVHNIFNLFDPKLRPKAMPPKELTTQSNKTPITFKRLGNKLALVATLSRHEDNNKTSK